ncbi:MAG: NUDIX hydrolase [Acidimicrobiales bacterium]
MGEIPAGKRDIDGEPQVTAARELEEEIGQTAGSLTELMLIHQSPGFCDEDQYIYIATDLTAVPQRLDGIEEQHLVVAKVTTDEAVAMCLDGRITDAKSICGILAAGRKLGW